MAAHLGPAGMPSTRDTKAPKFSGEVEESLDEFLREYEDLAASCTLDDQQKCETILRYVPEELRHLWKLLGGYSTHDWAVFRQSLERLYQNAAANALYTKQKLYDFVASNNTKHISDIRNVHQYYRKFHIYSQHLVEDNRITEEERDTAFWYGFHPDDREKLSSRLFAKMPDQLWDRPFGMNDVFKTACIIFANRPFLPIELQERQKAVPPPKPEQTPWYDQVDHNPRMSDHDGRHWQRQYDYQPKDPYEKERGRSPEHYYHPQDPSPPRHVHEYPRHAPPPPRKHEPPPDRYHHARPPSPRARASSPTRDRGPTVETRTVRFKEPTREDEDRELEELMDKLHGLSIRDRNYAVHYAHCVNRFPNVAQNLPKPDLCQTTQSYAFQNSAPYQNPTPYQNSPVFQNPATFHNPAAFQNPVPPAAASRQPWADRSAPPPPAVSDPAFYRPPSRCMFCSQTNHLIKECPIAHEYVRTGRAVVINNRMHLPNGQPIPPNVTGVNLQAKIDVCLAGSATVTPTQPQTSDPTSTPARDPPPHAAHCFEIVRQVVYGESVKQAHIVEVQDIEEDEEDLDLFEVYAAERRKRNAKASQLPELARPEEIEGSSNAPVLSRETPMNPPLRETLPIAMDKTSQEATTTDAPALAADTPPDHVSHPSTSLPVPQYRYQSNAEDSKLTAELYQWLLEGKLSLVTPAHVLAACPTIRKELIERLRTRRVDVASFEEIPSPVNTTPHSVLELSAPRIAKYSLPLREVDILINDLVPETGILDQGSQIVVIRQDLAMEAGAHINFEHQLEMEGANGLVSKTLGCAENLTMQIGDVTFEVHAHVVERAPFRLLLGRPFHHLLLCRLEDHADGRVDVSVCDPTNPARSVTIPSRARKTQVGFVRTLALQSPPPRFTGLKSQHTLTYHFVDQTSPTRVLAYKKVDRKVRPVSASLPEDYRIIRRIPVDPLLSLPPLPLHPPDFTPGTRLTQERLDDLELNRYNFLWPEEVKLLTHILRINELGLAWTEAEKGRFRDDYVSPVKIPVIEHVPWIQKNIPIPTGILENVIQIFRDKLAAGVYKHSDASYRSRWFCVEKKNGSLRLVHDLQPLNAVTVRNSGVPPLADQLIEAMAGRACYSMLDLFVGYDHRTLDVSSRDLTTIQSPIGALRLTCLPQGWTNAVAIFHEDVTFILEPEIPHVAWPFVDDCSIKGPASRYETEDGGYETLFENPGIRKFIWQHLNDVHRILHRLGCAGATVSAKKLFVAVPEVVILGHKCTYTGRVPDDSKIAKVRDWPPCKDLADVRGFLGLAGYMRIWIKDYSAIARPLVNLTRKGATFVWEAQHAEAMQLLKNAIINSSALVSIDYSTNRPVFLAVDSSWRGVGWILSQECSDGKRRPSRFGSISWNERESNYSQPKIELYGLFRALRALRLHLIGVRNLVVEMDAVFIRGMLNNPDVQPNAVINRWIAAILLFDFKLVHVPAEKHQGPDGLSRREHVEGEDDEEDDPEEWIDKTLGLNVWASYTFSLTTPFPPLSGNSSRSSLANPLPDAFSTTTGIVQRNNSLPDNILPFSTSQLHPDSTNSTSQPLSDVNFHQPLINRSLSSGSSQLTSQPLSDVNFHRPLINQSLSSECFQSFPLTTRSAARRQLLSPTLEESSPEATKPESTDVDPPIEFPSSSKSRDLEAEMMKIQFYLDTLRKPPNVDGNWEKFLRKAKRFLISNGRLWRRNSNGCDQLFIPLPDRLAIIRAAHDDLGHKGIYSTRRTLLDRFWWPTLDRDIKWYINTCHQCQLRQTTKVRIPPVVPLPAPLFRKAYIDTMHMTPASGFTYIVQARCSLTAWPEWRALRTETGVTLGRFIFEDILCRWGAVEELVTDNGTAYIAALDWLAGKYGINHIRISAYNSRANGIVERQHRTIRESLLKTCEGDASKWPAAAPHVFWADRVTTRKSTGHSPFYMAHGVEPILPFDITLATFLVPDLTSPLSTADLIATRARQLQIRGEDLANIYENVVKSRLAAAHALEKQFVHGTKPTSFKLGDLVLVRNSATETTHQRKMKPRYLGPMVVVKKTRNGAYRLAELDGAVSRLRFAAFRLIPYYARSRTFIPVTRLLDPGDLEALNNAEDDLDRADEDA